MVAKLRKQLASSRKSARTRVEKARTGHALTSVATGAVMGVLARKDIDLPFAGEVGTAAVAAAAAGIAGWYLKNETLMNVAIAAGTLAAHEFVEDSPLVSFLD